MATVEVKIPHDLEAQIMEMIQKRVDAALSVAEDVPLLLKLQASEANEDVDGNQMPPKQPRPKNNPTNFPNLPLVETGDMYDRARWHVERPNETTAVVVYDPPEHFYYLIAKDPDHGGRKWLTPDRINQTVRNQIEEEMVKRAVEVNDAGE